MELINNIKNSEPRKLSEYQMLEEMNNSDNLYYIPEQRFEKFENKFKRMVKVADKAGLIPPTYNVIEKIIVKILIEGSHDLTFRRKYIFHNFNIVSVNCPDIIKLPGSWILIGVIDHKNNGLIRPMPGQKIPEQYYNSSEYCDHCQTNRYRTETFVIQNEDGKYMKVGRQCIQKFLGIDGHLLSRVYIGFIKKMESYNNKDEMFSFGGYAGYDITEFLSLTIATIRNYGWVSKSKAEELDKTPTADIVTSYIENKSFLSKKEIERSTPTKDDILKAS